MTPLRNAASSEVARRAPFKPPPPPPQLTGLSAAAVGKRFIPLRVTSQEDGREGLDGGNEAGLRQAARPAKL